MPTNPEQDQGASADADRAATPSAPSRKGVSSIAGIPSAARRPTLSVYPKPQPARLLLARALGITTDEAGLALAALVEGGYGIAPRNPTNGMLAAYIEATEPPKHYEGVITAVGKARVRWQAMLEQGTAMAMSLKYIPRTASGMPLCEDAGTAAEGEARQPDTAEQGDAK